MLVGIYEVVVNLGQIQMVTAAYTCCVGPAARVAFEEEEEEGSGPAAARVESARRTKERCMVISDRALRDLIMIVCFGRMVADDVNV